MIAEEEAKRDGENGMGDIPNMDGMNSGNPQQMMRQAQQMQQNVGGGGGGGRDVHPHLQKYNTVYNVTGDDE